MTEATIFMNTTISTLFMYTVTAGVFAAFTAVLFTARSKRYRDVSKSTASEQRSSPI